MASIKISLASYITEKKKFNTTTTGVGGGFGSDFDQALRTAQAMVWSYGMGKSGIIGDFTTSQASSGNPWAASFLSEKMKDHLNDDTQAILQDCLKEVDGILTQNWDAVVYFAEELYKKEDLEYDDILNIFDKKFNLKPLTRPAI